MIGQLVAFLTMMKGLPLSYNRDLQWDKRFVFDAVEASHDALHVLALVMRHVHVRADRLPRLLESDALCATDLAEYLVERGVAFADAHAIIGRVVAAAERQGKQLRELRLDELQRFSSRLGRGALARLDPRRSVARKRSEGSTNPQQVARALARWKARLGN